MRSSGSNGLPWTIPTEASSPQQLGLARARRLLLHQLVDRLPEAEVVRRDRVERRRPTASMNRCLGRRGDRGEGRHLAGEERRHGSALGGRHVGGDADALADRLHRGPGIVVDHERPAEHDAPAWCARARRGSRCPAAARRSPARRSGSGRPGPRSGPGRPKSVTQRNHMSSIVPRIPDGAPSGGTSSTIGPSRQIDEAEEVDRVAVAGQEQRRRVHQLREQQDRRCPRPRSRGTPGGSRPSTRPGRHR